MTAGSPERSLIALLREPCAELARRENTSSREVLPVPLAPISTVKGRSLSSTWQRRRKRSTEIFLKLLLRFVSESFIWGTSLLAARLSSQRHAMTCRIAEIAMERQATFVKPKLRAGLRGLLREGAGVYISECREVENGNPGLRASMAHPCSVRCL